MATDLQQVAPHFLSPAGLAHRVDPRWVFAMHIRLMLRKIIECINTPNGRLMIFMPPRHGKSETVSRWTTSWLLGIRPETRIILTSYEADFAASWGKKARDVLDDHGYLYGVRVDPSSSATNRWELEKVNDDGLWTPTGGGMITSGVGGPITGRGFDLGVIDDPFKNAEESRSTKTRQNVWDWYLSTFYTRREPDASIILIMTRWHEDDLAARLLNQAKEDPDADEWEVLSLPAIAEKDEHWTVEDLEWLRSKGMALWPERYSAEALRSTRATVGSYFWKAMYQQDPQPAEDLGKFRRHWFKYLDERDWPELHGRVRFWDLAGTSDKDPTVDPDWTAGVLMGRDYKGTYIEDVRRFRKTSGAVDDEIVATAHEDGYEVEVRIEQEPGSSGKGMVTHYKRLKGLQGYTVRGYRTTGSKELRANPLAAEAEGTDGTDGRLYLRRGQWNKEFVDEAIQFPYGDHDDQVDAASGGYAVLTRGGRETVSPAGVDRTSPWRQGR